MNAVNLHEIGTALIAHPYAQRFLQRSTASNDNRVFSPDDVLGERIIRIGALLLIEHEKPGWMIFGGKGEGRAAALADLARDALTATPYLWTEEARAACRQIHLPQHVISPRVLPVPRSWHTFETGIKLGGELDYDGRHFEGETADALFIRDVGSRFGVATLGEMKDAETGEIRPIVSTFKVDYGTTYPDDLRDTPEFVAAGGALMLCAFLNSPFIPKRQFRASRAARREAKRNGAGGMEEEQAVTFVILRRPATYKHSADEPPGVVEWKHRWIVSGHLRAQWYATEQAHRLIWIAPYMKGPEDAPLLEHVFKVAR